MIKARIKKQSPLRKSAAHGADGFPFALEQTGAPGVAMPPVVHFGRVENQQQQNQWPQNPIESGSTIEEPEAHVSLRPGGGGLFPTMGRIPRERDSAPDPALQSPPRRNRDRREDNGPRQTQRRPCALNRGAGANDKPFHDQKHPAANGQNHAPLSEPESASAENAQERDLYPLQRQWMWWVHRPCIDGKVYKSACSPMAQKPVGTIEAFWRHQNNLPAPSLLFRKHRKRIERRRVKSTLEGISFFESGVLPEWEHVRNAFGSTVKFKGSFDPEHADAVWERTLLSLVGEHCSDDVGHITGVRLVDRISNIRLEVWVDDDQPALASRVGRWFMDNVFVPSVLPHGLVTDFFVTVNKDAKTIKGGGVHITARPPYLDIAHLAPGVDLSKRARGARSNGGTDRGKRGGGGRFSGALSRSTLSDLGCGHASTPDERIHTSLSARHGSGW